MVKGLLTYRGIYVMVGIILAVLVTQSSLTDRTQRWVLVAYIVGGIVVTEFLRKKASKKNSDGPNNKENGHP